MLSERDRYFVTCYLTCLNGPEAWRKMEERFGEKPNKNPKNAAYKVLHREDVQELLKKEREKRGVAVGIQADDVLAELRDQLSVTLPDVATWSEDGIKLKPVEQLTEAERKAVKRVKVTKTVRKKIIPALGGEETITETQCEIELHDRMRVVQLVGEHLGMWDGDGKKTTVNNTVVIVPQRLSPEEWAKKAQQEIDKKTKPAQDVTVHVHK